MSQFDEIIKNIALENEKCKYNPEIDRDWGKLLYFMQRECIKHMDVKTKIRLSQTSKYEKHRFSEENLKLEFIAGRIALETGKSNYNPEIDLNWCNLPMEMRNECVKHLDFKTRCRFRGVSKTEMTLIDRKKFKLAELHITYDFLCNTWDIIAGTRSGTEIRTIPRLALDYGCISAVLKHAETEEFSLLGEDHFETRMRPVLEKIVKLGPFQFESLWIHENPFIDFFMKLCENLVKIDFEGDTFPFPYKEVLELPSVMNVKEFLFAYVKVDDFLEFLNGLVQKWIDNDVETGKSVQFHMATGGIIDKFAEKFADRIIEKTDEIVRIRMNNDKTQIMLRLIGYYEGEEEDDDDDDEIEELCSCKIIPIDTPESEYGKGDEWIQKIYDKCLDKPKID